MRGRKFTVPNLVELLPDASRTYLAWSDSLWFLTLLWILAKSKKLINSVR
jgi:hypothetical protein